MRLYSLQTSRRTRFNPNFARMCALNPECGTVYPRALCHVDYDGVGSRWIEFSLACLYHTGIVTDALQQIRSGEVIAAPAGAERSGTEILELNSATGARRLCSPLRAPTYGKFIPDGRFAVTESNLNENVFLERYGSHSRTMIGRGVFSVNSRAVVMSVGSTSDVIDGLFLPSRRRFALRLPRQVASLCARVPPFVCIPDLVLTGRTVYILTDHAQLWAAGSGSIKPRIAARQLTMRISRLVLFSRRPPSFVATTMSSILTPNRPGR